MTLSFDAGFDAARRHAALFNLDDWTSLRVTGKDAAAFLHNFCTNDIKGLPAGIGCEAFLTNVKARVIAHTLIFKEPGEVGYRMLSGPGQAQKILAHLDRYIITEDVTIIDDTHARGILALVGPHAEKILVEAGVAPPSGTESQPLAMSACELSERNVVVFKLAILGLPCFLIESSLDDVDPIVEQCNAQGVSLANLEVFNGLRVEAVYPLSGVDATEDDLAPEIDRPWAIHYAKGCYLGQEPIARIDALGHTNRALRGLRLSGEFVPPPGTPIVTGEKTIGEIRSTANSGADGKIIALAMIRTSHAQPGTEVTVKSEVMESSATVFAGLSNNQQ